MLSIAVAGLTTTELPAFTRRTVIAVRHNSKRGGIIYNRGHIPARARRQLLQKLRVLYTKSHMLAEVIHAYFSHTRFPLLDW
jgi:hypothetical protein